MIFLGSKSLDISYLAQQIKIIFMKCFNFTGSMRQNLCWWNSEYFPTFLTYWSLKLVKAVKKIFSYIISSLRGENWHWQGLTTYFTLSKKKKSNEDSSSVSISHKILSNRNGNMKNGWYISKWKKDRAHLRFWYCCEAWIWPLKREQRSFLHYSDH